MAGRPKIGEQAAVTLTLEQLDWLRETRPEVKVSAAIRALIQEVMEYENGNKDTSATFTIHFPNATGRLRERDGKATGRRKGSRS